MVGTGENKDWHSNQLSIWNDELGLKVASLDFFSKIIDLRVVENWILVALIDRVISLDFNQGL